MATSFASVPLIDFRALGDSTTQYAELKKLKHALFSVGFLYVINTGVEVGILVNVLDMKDVRLIGTGCNQRNACGPS